MSAVRRPLLVTADPEVLDDVLRLAATAGVEVEAVTETAAVRLRWQAAPLVLLGADVTAALVDAGLPARNGVAVICRGSPPAALWPSALACGAARVFALPDGEAELADHLADAVEATGEPGRVVAVVGGSGGAGASVLAAALAVVAARLGHEVTLVDADPAGGGLDIVLGAEQTSGLRWADLSLTSGRVSGSALREALPRPHGVAVLSFGRDCPTDVPAQAMRSVLTAARRTGGLVVVDIPRHLTPAAHAALRLTDVAFTVVPPELRAATAAMRVITPIRDWVDDVRLVVHHPTIGGLPAADVAAALGLPLAGEYRSEPGLAAALVRGDAPARRGRGPLATVCRRLLGELPADVEDVAA